MTFIGNECWLQVQQTKGLIRHGKSHGNLNFLEREKQNCNIIMQDILAVVDNSYTSVDRSCKSNIFSYDVKGWHITLSHPSAKVLSHIDPCLRNKTIDCMFCEVCAKAKMHKLPFTTSIITIRELF